MRNATRDVFEGEEVAEVLSGTYYARGSRPRARAVAPAEQKPSHYKVICISLYTEDLQRLDGMVEELKRCTATVANFSRV